ncbi:MAG: PD-(D/E)XK nuclease family protein, partial [Clostridia bacterium]|nr:PD-(D/E)XK nuclease family protein [Clostridia bacterium]
GKLWIVDFKTDRVQQVEELKDRYQKQLELYSLAVEETTGEQVAGRILYSVRLGKSVSF